MSGRSVADLFPDVETLLELESEELGAAILELWPQISDRSGKAHFDQFIEPIYALNSPEIYPRSSRDHVVVVMAEAWQWLEHEGLILDEPTQPMPRTWYRRTRKGEKLKSRVDVQAYRQASLLPKQLLHPMIEEKAWPTFRRGEYDAAVLLAFKAVEVAVRDACEYEDNQLGTDLMRKAFHEEHGPLTDKLTLVPERNAVGHLFAGAIGHAKNPQSHRDKPLRIEEAARLLMFASYLMEIVDTRRILM